MELFLGDDQYALGWIQETYLQGTLNHQVIQMYLYACGHAACPSVISIPWLSNTGVGRTDIPDKGEDPQAIY